MLLTQLLTPERVRVPLAARDKPGVLRELSELLAQESGGTVADVLRAVVDREQVLSTGVGFGIAIPHGRSPSMPDLAAVAGRSSEPIEFDALDGEPVNIFFMLVGPERCAGQHVKALSRIARLARSEALRQQLLTAPTGAEFYQALADAESR
jgi:mannitol/fructose-specific phosphotransferase system IIA component (Ntr-type)